MASFLTPRTYKDHLTDLQTAVADGDYDIGFAQDPDADRLVIVDENGQFIGEDYSLAFCMDYFLAHCAEDNEDVVVNLSTSKSLSTLQISIMQIFITLASVSQTLLPKMKAINAIIGGEGNGGVILPKVGWGRDSLTGICLALLHLSTANQTFSQ